MADLVEMRVDSRAAIRALEELGTRAADGRIPLRRWYQGYRARVITAWGKMRPSGGLFRGVFPWAKTKDQYTRKTDGVTVPVYGGVARVQRGYQKAKAWATDIATRRTQRRGVSTGERMARTSGNVSGKLRKSGQRWTAKDVPLMDTGELRDFLFPPRPSDVTRSRLRIGGTLPDWQAKLAREHHLLAVLPEDQAALNQVAIDYAREIAAQFNQGGTSRA